MAPAYDHSLGAYSFYATKWNILLCKWDLLIALLKPHILLDAPVIIRSCLHSNTLSTAHTKKIELVLVLQRRQRE